MVTNNEALVEQLTELILKGNAHVTFDQSVANVAFENLRIKAHNLPYTIWQLVEHIRITQNDILEFSRDPNHVSPKWPEGYWPSEGGPAQEAEWQNTLLQIRRDRGEFVTLLSGADLYAPFPYGDGQNLLREALLIADHTSYHTGQIILLRRLLNDWES